MTTDETQRGDIKRNTKCLAPLEYKLVFTMRIVWSGKATRLNESWQSEVHTESPCADFCRIGIQLESLHSCNKSVELSAHLNRFYN